MPTRAPDGAAALLADLERTSPLETVVHDGTTWEVRWLGTGRRGLLVCPGAVGTGDALVGLVPALASSYRIGLLAYPRVSSLDRLIDGLCHLVAAAGLDTVSVYGGSFGGLVAQAFAARNPARVPAIVLSGAGVPDPSRAARNERLLPWIRRCPFAATRGLLRLVVWLTTRHAVEKAAWRRFYGRALDAFTVDDLESRYRLSIDFDRRAIVETLRESWHGRMLVLEGAEDSVAHGSVRAALRQAYPTATFVTFEGAGHGLALDRPRDWAKTVAEFLLVDEP
ncbi:MAG: alpha/beta hydrolase [Vicinamibacterales bacterium]